METDTCMRGTEKGKLTQRHFQQPEILFFFRIFPYVTWLEDNAIFNDSYQFVTVLLYASLLYEGWLLLDIRLFVLFFTYQVPNCMHHYSLNIHTDKS